ncbi:MAG: glutamate--tRNA ligase family protein [Candidatus Paceibacterota bacterium]|jgi:glutamyl-tRNA synthetase
MKNNIVTRFAPSPTGLLHAGNYRTAVFSYLFARQNQGKFILRIEDTDRERSKKEYTDNIIESLNWLGLDYDEIFHQSERVSSHQKYLEKLIAEDKAYVSKEERPSNLDPTKDWREEVIRFRNPDKQVSFHDLIRGLIVTDTTDLGDFVIAKSLTEPVFHLAVVVDDFEMGVTQVVRGEDHISNTPRQILIQEAIGAPTPEYAHLPLVLAPDRSKLSKRRGALAISEYRDRGYLPEALLNYMALLGWNPGTDQEIFSKNELIKSFALSKVQKGAAIFDQIKLDWFNREYLKQLSPDRLKKDFAQFIPEKFLPLAQTIIERVNNLSEAQKLIENGEFDFFLVPPQPSRELLKEGKFLEETIALLEKLPAEDFEATKIKDRLWAFATEQGRGAVLWPMRVALTGQEKSPDPFTIASLLGKEETLNRLKYAQEILN